MGQFGPSTVNGDLEVTGGLIGVNTGAFSTITTITSNYTASSGELVDVDASGGAVTVTLPSSPSASDFVHVSKRDSSSNTVTIDGNGNNINGETSQSIGTQYNAITMYYNGTEWAIQ